MKTRLLTIIVAAIVAVGIFTGMYSVNVIQNYQNQKQLRGFSRKKSCNSKHAKRREKQTDSESSDSNFVIVYSTFDHNQNRIYTEPHDLTIYLEKDDRVTWINNADHTATVYDRETGSWSTGEIKPTMQKSIQFNSTGFYQYSVNTEIDRHHG